MLKGDFEIAGDVIVLVAVVLGIMSFIGAVSLDTEVRHLEYQDKLEALDFAHLAKGCLETDGTIVFEELQAIDNVIDYCSFSRSVFVRVSDKEDPARVWDSGVGSGEETHSLTVPLRVGNEVHIGELFVTV